VLELFLWKSESERWFVAVEQSVEVYITLRAGDSPEQASSRDFSTNEREAGEYSGISSLKPNRNISCGGAAASEVYCIVGRCAVDRQDR
jgi:hypothetical protein